MNVSDMRLTSIIFVLAALVWQAIASCPNGWIHHRQSCYHFSHDFETFAGADFICTNWDGQLVEIEDNTENLFLGNIAQQRNSSFVIGLTDLVEEGFWLWYGSKTSPSFQQWGSGEPNNANLNENCVEIGKTGDWNDVPCNGQRRYICEMQSDGDPVIG